MILIITEVTFLLIFGLGTFFVFMICLTAFSWILKSVLKEMKILSEFAHFVRFRILLRRIESKVKISE